MKLLSLIALVPLTTALFVPGPKNLKGQALADYINSRQSLWKAESPKISLASVKKRLMDVKYTKHPEGVKMLEAHTLPNAADDIPDEFDARTQWPQCQSISTIRDQSDCGSCWAFAGTEVMSDRICIATNGEKQIYVSDDDLLSCCGKTCGDGCDGGWPIEAFNYWKNTGIVSGGRFGSKDGCRPYELSPCGGDSPYGECPDNGYDTPKCKKQCQKGYDKNYDADKTHGKTSYAVPGAVATVQREIMARGPVEVAFTVYEDFYSYKSGVYSHTWGDALGGHAVRILGWGTENSVPYWVVANSWSETWGENGGYFRIVRGTNESEMRSLLVALALVAASYAFVAQKTIHPDPQAIVNKINAGQNLWKAAVKAKPIENIKKKLMDVKYTQLPAGTPEHPEITTIKDDDVPDSFDARTAWPNCQNIGFIRDQSDCGSCWAFGAAEAMSDRTCIQSNGNVNVKLSADDILSCCGNKCGYGCEGGYPIEAWNFWVKTGICTGGAFGDTTTCRPYEIPPCGNHGNITYDPCPDTEYDTPTCKKQCVAGYPTSYIDDKHFGKTAAAVSKKVAAIQKEIMTNGPVEAAYTVYEDFYYYTTGIYKYQFGGIVGGHAVKILGWGTEGGVDYWLVANSWAADWGESGYFRILRGTNECGIEHAIVAGMAKV